MCKLTNYLTKKHLHQLLPGVRFLLLGAFLLFATAVLAQTITVKGKVTDAANGEGIPGANVVVKGTTSGIITDMDGNYSLKVPSNGTLQISFIGYTKTEVPVAGKTEINVLLTAESIGLDEVVAIGYGTVKKRDITGSVSSVQGNDLRAIPVVSAAEAITGKLAGVQVLSTEGSPDAEMRIRVRGGGSITQDNSPLFIVDGFPVNSISDIAPSDIQSIDVLKDASSTAIYGSRGANGVIIVTTKSGKSGKLMVSYNNYIGFKHIAKELKTLSPEDYVNWQYEYAVLKNGITSLTSYEKYFGKWQDRDMYSGQPGNNWQDQVYGRTGQVFNHDLSIRGGSDKLMYSLNYAHINEKAIMVGSDFSRDNISMKFNHKANDKIELSFSLRYSDTKINGGGANEQNEVSSADSRLKHSVTYTPIPLSGLTSDATDEEVSSYLVNPLVATADNNREQERKNFNMAGSFGWNVIENMQLKTEVGLDNYNNIDNRFYGLTTYYIKNAPAAENQGKPAVILSDEKEEVFRNTNTLNYNFKGFLNENHNAKILIGQELIQSNFNELTTVVHGFPTLFNSDQAFKLTTQGVANSTDNNYSPDDKLLSYFGRLNYDYKGKYLFAGTFRADGSSKFSKNNRWGYFPSAAVAWRISNEGFLLGSKSWLDDLKLRFSYGTAGNNNIPSGQMVQTFASITTSWMNGYTSYWSASKTMANPELKWETTYTRNLGLDFSMFKSRVNGTIEAYFNNTKDLLIKFPVSGTGYEYQYRNMGETENKGLELTLNAVAIEKKNVGLTFSFNIGFNKNKIKSLGIMNDFGAETGWASTEIGTDFWIAKGGSVGEMYGHVSDGRYEVSDFSGYNSTTNKWILKDGVADATGIVGTLRPGMMKLKNLVGEGNAITIDDRTIIGDANPIHTGGFTVNGRIYDFDLSAVFNWSYGNDIYNANKVEYSSSTAKYQYRNMIDIMADGNRWTNLDATTGTLVNDPALLASMNANTTMWSPYMSKYVFSDWAVEDGSFLRLSTLTLGYTLPSTLTKKVNIQSLRFYMTGYNVLLLTNYSGFDPEVSTRRNTALTPGVDYSAYPRSRQIVFGLNLNF
jgi:TonB-linked SusC/RagA family outer membrane protein